MTPEEKAIDLVQKFEGLVPKPFDGERNIRLSDSVKLRSLICCNEVLKALPMYTGNLNPTWKYWDDVKKIIQSF